MSAPACLVEADRFLRALGGVHTFQTFSDRTPTRRLIQILHGTLAKHATTLVRLNADGAGVFVMVNAGDGKGRKGGNVRSVRALFADLDGAPLEPVTSCALAPHVIVESSPERWHAYWLVEGVPLEQFTPLQRAIASRFNGDTTVHDLPRVMRVPGFLHNKADPFPTRIVTMTDRARYTLADMLREFPTVAEPVTPQRVPTVLPDWIPKGERNSTLFGLARGLVNRGIDSARVNSRIQRINAERCRPPMCASEVDGICSNASREGSNGFSILPHALLDSEAWKHLPPEACAIVLTFYRRHNGSNNGRLALPWSDFERCHGISERRFYRHLRTAVMAGVLVKVKDADNRKTGRTPAMYAIAERYLHKAQPPNPMLGPTPESAVLSR